MVLPVEIRSILNDRVSGLVLLLNRLIKALKKELEDREPVAERIIAQVTALRGELNWILPGGWSRNKIRCNG